MYRLKFIQSTLEHERKQHEKILEGRDMSLKPQYSKHERGERRGRESAHPLVWCLHESISMYVGS
jgi:hypothetical protein